MDKMTPRLEGTYRMRTLTPVIVEATPNRFESVKDKLLEMTSGLSSRVIFPRLRVAPYEKGLFSFKPLKAFNMVAVLLSPQLVEEVVQWREVRRVYPDSLKWATALPDQALFKDGKGNLFTSTFWTKKHLGLEEAMKLGYDGRGIGAAVIDTGCRNSHPQLKRVNALSAMLEKGGTGFDANGHGTWCAATLGGKYAVDSRFNAPVEGMAPGCSLFSIQALGFVVGMGTTSDTLQAMEMCLGLDVKVVSMSLGGAIGTSDEDNPETVGVNALVSDSKIPVVAAGNSGPRMGTITSPGSCGNALTVGSIDVNGEISSFSSRGPTEDGYVKPDVLSYGGAVDSALAGYLDHLTDKRQVRYGVLSGTSMSAPHVSGLVTCMAQLYKEHQVPLVVDEVKRMMQELGQPKDDVRGWGLITWPMVTQWFSSEHGG